MQKWNIKQRTTVFKTPMFTLVNNESHHPDKDAAHDFYTFDSRDWINIVATTEDNRIIFVKQHRLGTDAITLETPGGVIESNEAPKVCAERELLEETGYNAAQISLMKKVAVNPAIQNNSIYLYHASGCKKIAEQNLDDTEDIEVLIYTIDEVRKMLFNESINHSIVHLGLMLYFSLEL